MTVLPADRAHSERPRRTRVLLWVVYGLFTASCISGVVVLLSHYRGISFSHLVGAMFLLFGIFKIILAYDAYHAPRAQAPLSDQRTESGRLFTLWLFYKLLPGILAVGVGLVLIVHRVPYLDRMPLVHLG